MSYGKYFEKMEQKTESIPLASIEELMGDGSPFKQARKPEIVSEGEKGRGHLRNDVQSQQLLLKSRDLQSSNIPPVTDRYCVFYTLLFLRFFFLVKSPKRLVYY